MVVEVLFSVIEKQQKTASKNDRILTIRSSTLRWVKKDTSMFKNILFVRYYL